MTETTNKKRLTDIEIDELVEKYIFLKQKLIFFFLYFLLILKNLISNIC